jgi:hypothetical protein
MWYGYDMVEIMDHTAADSVVDLDLLAPAVVTHRQPEGVIDDSAPGSVQTTLRVMILRSRPALQNVEISPDGLGIQRPAARRPDCLWWQRRMPTAVRDARSSRPSRGHSYGGLPAITRCLLTDGVDQIMPLSMNALLVGYARVSTEHQDLTAQRDALSALGVGDDRI